MEEEDVEMPDVDEWQEELEEEVIEDAPKARVKVDLGTFVYPRVPFPYFFDLGSSGLLLSRDKEKEDVEMEEMQAGTAAAEEKEKVEKSGNGEEGEIREGGEKVKEEEEVMEEGGIKGDVNENEKTEEGEKDSAQQQQQGEQFTIDVETRATIVIPSGHIPLEKPLHTTRPRIWGGGLIGRTRHPANPYSSRHKSTTRRRSSSGRRSSGMASSSKPLEVPSGGHQGKKRLPRRIYTDDSDLFLCAIHAGWVTWSGAARARALGRDMRVEVRVLRCTGAGVGSIFAGGGGGDDDAPSFVKEEVVGRFLAGWGERCMRVCGRKGLLEEEEALNQERGEEEEGEDDDDVPENDGRGLASAAWGSGHDGSAIEIVGVEFVEVKDLY